MSLHLLHLLSDGMVLHYIINHGAIIQRRGCQSASSVVPRARRISFLDPKTEESPNYGQELGHFTEAHCREDLTENLHGKTPKNGPKVQ